MLMYLKMGLRTPDRSQENGLRNKLTECFLDVEFPDTDGRYLQIPSGHRGLKRYKEGSEDIQDDLQPGCHPT